MISKKNKIYFLVLFVTVIIMGCKENKQKESLENRKEKYYKQDPTYKSLSIIVDIQDTLVLGEKYRGELKFHHLLQDSIKVLKKDERFNIVYLNTFSHKRKINEIIKKECDSFYGMANKLKDTIITPFYITPKKLGSQYIGFIIDEETYLSAYQYKDSTKSRVLFNTFTINKNIYVKSSIGDIGRL